ncbi:S8 family serine peptidase [Mucilaginibacter sp. UR6-11]|uniref:S8 family serine peptidase n=1 Tax=Mucilaginibacter sp. UR6-11 TaxID=1435644 RepID=UPI001E51506E|nr:S8 family serine peptidase [Mucilaginibacter sp. UR6-11]MCC8423594.1 S8 family serine peptidase [Mucilaginibacter sp. UR6-11]
MIDHPNKVILTIFFLLMAAGGVFAQSPAKDKNWQNLDLRQDSVFGISTERAYRELLNGKKGIPVIVAVIDGGVDISHEDLRNAIWTNPKEVPDNHKDDDKNDYTDDVHGWNFLGSEKGSFLVDNAEIVRSLRVEIQKDPASNTVADLRQQIQRKREGMIRSLEKSNERISVLKTILEKMGKEHPTLNELEDFKYSNEPELNMLVYIVKTMKATGQDFAAFKEQLEDQNRSYQNHVDVIYNIDCNPRADQAGQQPHHGNGNVQGLKGIESLHGTHIAGIIAAGRNNGIGINGVCSSAKIMAIRTVPIGEYLDQDMADAIRYAADNGARVINLSINKNSSPEKKQIDDAVRYALDKDVLIIHAAGNNGKEDELEYPNRNYTTGTQAAAWIEVGASGPKDDKTLQGWFSNYGKNTDVFAPGVGIYSCIPGNGYKVESGTSMAAPVVAGLAALIREYYPKLTAVQVKEIIMRSVIKREVLKDKCISGGVVNAYEALKLAQTF